MIKFENRSLVSLMLITNLDNNMGQNGWNFPTKYVENFRGIVGYPSYPSAINLWDMLTNKGIRDAGSTADIRML